MWRVGIRRIGLFRNGMPFQQQRPYSAVPPKEKIGTGQFLLDCGTIIVSLYGALRVIDIPITFTTVHFADQEKIEEWEFAIKEKYGRKKAPETTLVRDAAEGNSPLMKEIRITLMIRREFLKGIEFPFALIVGLFFAPQLGRKLGLKSFRPALAAVDTAAMMNNYTKTVNPDITPKRARRYTPRRITRRRI